ncbi:hypothetical protein [Glycomyces terrestris]|uniref:Uncharacterized protein n=1 Tax=Glycomyces terrestris TaxID=2493553 RepID=A0A426V406_9ACTN|nr:hypothetical protein [Glycomyces terrestris]RRS01649.1 hypothetical protein EIW28_02480 [Glycomyces terrestris]
MTTPETPTEAGTPVPPDAPESRPAEFLPAAPPRRRNPLLVWVIVGPAAAFFIGLTVGLTGNGSGGGAAADDDHFEAVKEACAVGSSDVRVGDGGDTLSIDRAGAEEMPGATLTQYYCILDELEVPDSVRDRMDNTRALDGYQEAEFDGITVTWNYHPDDGVNMTFTRAS